MKIKQQKNTSCSVNPYDRNITIWGFMLENTLFTPFQQHNHVIIENAWKDRKKKSSSTYVDINDNNLPSPHSARVYFGVAQMHLRMPGTRYYVKRGNPRDLATTISPSSKSSYHLTPPSMPSPMSTASTTTTSTAVTASTSTSTSTSASSNYLPPVMDVNLANIFPNMVLKGQNSNAFSYSPNSYDQYYAPIDNRINRNGANNGYATTVDNYLAIPTKNNGNLNQTKQNPQTYIDASLNTNNYYNGMNVNQASYMGQHMHYVDNTQYKKQQTQKQQQQQQQPQQQQQQKQQKQQQQPIIPMSSILDYTLPGSIVNDTSDYLQDIDWLNDDSLYTPPSSFNSNISFQELVSWPCVSSSLIPKFDNGDNGNIKINMTNDYYQDNHFTYL
ncbi:hypothetical protein BD408DRAFT_454952 [Parasitella parasitica]|nr:hypothetical protein BD408DRAFT_454952 [Parasitella parasitica]